MNDIICELNNQNQHLFEETIFRGFDHKHWESYLIKNGSNSSVENP